MGYPHQVSWEFTRRCNLMCKTCGRPVIAEEMKSVDMTDSLFRTFSEELHRFNSPEVFVIAGLGEPTLHPKFSDYLFKLRSLFPETFIRLFTNGVLLDRHMKAVVGCCDSVVVGLNFAGEQNYERFTGTKNYGKVLKNIEHLLDETEFRHSSKVAVQLLDIKQNLPYSVELMDWLKPKLNCNAILQRVPIVTFAGLVDTSQYVFADDVLNEEKKRYPCWELWQHAFFCANGDVYPCCVGTPLREELLMGNVNDERLAVLLRGNKLHEFRDQMLKGDYSDLPHCYECNVWKREPKPWLRVFGKWR